MKSGSAIVSTSWNRKRREVASLETQRAVLDALISGKSPDEIASELGVTDATVYEYVESGLSDGRLQIAEDIERYRGISFLRLERLISYLWPSALNHDLGAVDKIRALIADERKLLNLDRVPEPVRAELTVSGVVHHQVTRDESVEIFRVLEQLGLAPLALESSDVIEGELVDMTGFIEGIESEDELSRLG